MWLQWQLSDFSRFLAPNNAIKRTVDLVKTSPFSFLNFTSSFGFVCLFRFLFARFLFFSRDFRFFSRNFRFCDEFRFFFPFYYSSLPSFYLRNFRFFSPNFRFFFFLRNFRFFLFFSFTLERLHRFCPLNLESSIFQSLIYLGVFAVAEAVSLPDPSKNLTPSLLNGAH